MYSRVLGEKAGFGEQKCERRQTMEWLLFWLLTKGAGM